MLKARLFAAVALLWFCTSAWAGGSTINPAVPVFGAAMSSAPIRNNFASAFSDVNGLIGQNNSVTAPSSPVLGQLWLNTSAAPYVLNEWDGSAWVAQGTLNASTHLWSFPLTGVVPWTTLTGTPTTLAGYGITNGVSSVGLTMPSIFSCAGSPVTSSGTVSCSLASQSPNLFLASPAGASGAPTFRVIQPSDIPTLNQNTAGNAATATTATLATLALSANTANTATTATTATTAGNVTGVVALANGGTASTTAAAAFNALSPMTTTGDVEYESASGTASRLPIGSNGQVFTVVSGAPAWASSSSALVGTLKRSTHTTTYTTTTGDQQSVLYNTGTWTLTLTAPATLGNGWWEIVQNAGTGNITLSPASGTVDGLSSFVMYPGEVRIVNTDGTNFYSVVLNPFSLKLLSTTTITIPPGYQAFTGILWGGGGGGMSGAGGGNVEGGGGGAAVPFNFASLGTVGATITCTVAGTAAVGTNGSSSTLGSLLTAYGGYQGSGSGGGGGGGALSSGFGSTGGAPGLSTGDGPGLGGAGSGGNSAWGGAGAGQAANPAGKAVYGGGGGGGGNGSTASVGGTSIFGGAGGAGSNSGAAGAGLQPAGGGGGAFNGTGGSGAAGECYINGVI